MWRFAGHLTRIEGKRVLSKFLQIILYERDLYNGNWESKIRVGLGEMDISVVNWIKLAWYRDH
jgi:hypothetical protein